ncbi:hypothetical protein E2C01_092846 [Portunus trituberculatus]|uniref:Uncharacterized protein n=1 Tax=Portunus trituberculatus TaxID=210409 RepID=A0A5B7JX05_PORTR|nr:hypothetical protein [Portunus trituberculatus]
MTSMCWPVTMLPCPLIRSPKWWGCSARWTRAPASVRTLGCPARWKLGRNLL